MTDYIRLSDLATASKAFWGQDKWRQMRDNQDSHEERIAQLLAQSHQAVVDDFLGSSAGASASGVDDSLYDVQNAGTSFKTMMAASGDHVLRINKVGTGSNTTQTVSPKLERLAFRLNQDMSFFGQFRTEDIGGTAPLNLVCGYSADTDPSNENDVIAFMKGTTAGKWRFRVAKGGVATTTDNIGNRATWQKLRIEVTRASSGGTLQVRAYIDGAQISGSPFTTNIPDTTVLRKVWGAVSPGAGTTDIRLDRWETRWNAIPENS